MLPRLPLEGVRVLVVEDDDELRESLAEVLRANGACVTGAASGNAAFAEFLRERQDVVVSDLSMPDGSGYELIQRVRQLPVEQGGGVPAVAVSATENAQAALGAGFHLFLAKPFDCFKLIDILAGLLHPPQA